MSAKPSQIPNVGVKCTSKVDSTKLPTTASSTKKRKVQQSPKPIASPYHVQLSSSVGQSSTSSKARHTPTNILESLSLSSLNLENYRLSQFELPVSDVNSSSSTLVGVEATRSKCMELVSEVPNSNNPSLENPSPEALNKPVKFDGHSYTLDHFAAIRALESLIEKHSTIAHMGVLDPSYTFFMNKSRTAALYYKVKNKIAVVGGDPLCPDPQWHNLLIEFTQYRKKHSLGIAILGASQEFVKYATEQGWVSMKFGTERALNPITNKVIAEIESKRVVKQVKQLIREGTKLNVYVPARESDLELQARLTHVYDVWRAARNETGKPQAYMTVFNPFAIPHIMIYIYTTNQNGAITGFAALRKLKTGYHIDPYCALPDAPRGISELLIYGALSILNRAGVPYLGLGFEPSQEMTEIQGLSPSMSKMVKSGYQRTFSRLPISGKKAFHDKWHPDEDYDRGLYIIYPEGQPGLRHSLAMMHFANVSAKDIMEAEFREKFGKQKERKVAEKEREAVKLQKHSIAYGVHETSEYSVHLAMGLRTT